MKFVKRIPVVSGARRVKPVLPVAGTGNSALLNPGPACHSMAESDWAKATRQAASVKSHAEANRFINRGLRPCVARRGPWGASAGNEAGLNSLRKHSHIRSKNGVRQWEHSGRAITAFLNVEKIASTTVGHGASLQRFLGNGQRF